MNITVRGTDTSNNKVKLKMMANSKGQGNKDLTSALGEAEFVVDVPRNTKALDLKVSSVYYPFLSRIVIKTLLHFLGL